MSGALGTGGGLLLVPLIAGAMNHQGFSNIEAFKISVATSLAIIFVTSLSSVIFHLKHGNLAIKKLWLVFIATAVGAFILAPLCYHYIPARFIVITFITFSLYAAYKLTFIDNKKVNNEINFKIGTAKRLAFSFLGFPLGGFCGVLGVSGGGMSISLFRCFDLSSREIIAATACLALPISFFSCLSYSLAHGQSLGASYLGYVYLPAFFSIALVGIAFSYVGGRVSILINVSYLKKFLAIVLIIVSVKLFIGLI